MLAPWTGDLDGMVERRYVRMLVTFSRTNYFLDKATQRGITYEAGKMFEDFLNKRLGSKTIRVHVAFIPVTATASSRRPRAGVISPRRA
jgi:membrane-bound lytic murein transglycosylase MltF